MMVLKDDSTIFSQRIKKQKALKKFEEKVKLMETNWDEFCLLVNLIRHWVSVSTNSIIIEYFASNSSSKIKVSLHANRSNFYSC